MKQITKHFNIDEIKCHCGCGQKFIDRKLYQILENFREFSGNLPMITHCVNRCIIHNRKVGGVEKSKHLKGMGWDGHIVRMKIKKLHKLAKKAYKKNIICGGLGFYPWGIHIDSGEKRKWKG